MASADGRITIEIELEDGTVRRGLADIGNDADRVGDRATSAFGKAGNALKTVGAVAVGVVAGVGALGLAVGGLAAPLVKAAADAQALNSQFSTVFGNLESTAQKTINAIGAATGINSDRLKASFTQIAAFAKTTGVDTEGALSLSNRALIAAADSAAFYDRSLEETTESLQSFLKGNFENDAALGISATETTRNAVANRLYGKSFIELDEAQKQLALLQLVEDGNELSGAFKQASRESDGLENVLGNLRQVYENFKISLGDAILETAIGLLKGLTATIASVDTTIFVAAIERAINILKSLIEFALPFAKQFRDTLVEAIENIRQFWDQNGQTILSNTISILTNLYKTVSNVISTVVNFLRGALSDITKYFDANGADILSIITKAFNAILAVINFVMPAIRFIIDVVWTAISNVITGALDVILGTVKIFSGLLSGDFSKLWEGIKQVFSGAIDFIFGLISLSFIGAIRTAVTNFAKLIVNGVKNNWTTIINFFKTSTTSIATNVSNFINAVLGFFRNLATNGLTAIRTLWTNVSSAFSAGVTNAKNFVIGLKDSVLNTFGSINLFQIGADIIQGLINGIGSLASAAVDAVVNVGKGIVEGITNILDIHSPSRVMRQIGIFTGQGLVQGIEASERSVTKASEELGYNLLDVAEGYAQQQLDLEKKLGEDIASAKSGYSKKIEKIQKDSNDKINKLLADATKKQRNLTTSEQEKVLAITKERNSLIVEEQQDLNKKLSSIESANAKQFIKNLNDNNKEYLNTVKSFISDKKSTNEISLADEISLWNTTIEIFHKGSAERIEAQQSYNKALETLNKEINDINKSYSDESAKINDQLISDIEKLNKGYDDALSARQNTLYNFASLFDEFTLNSKNTGEQLLNNLNDQVDGFKMWQQQLDEISARGIDDSLLTELSKLGPKALPELMQLNELTNDQLTKYSDLFVEKSRLAREQALQELAPLNEDVRSSIEALENIAAVELNQLQYIWRNEIAGIAQGTKEELLTLEKIGEDAASGLLQGLQNITPALKSQAQEMADIIKSTLENALDIHSPSRYMRDFIAGNLATGFDEGVNKSASSFEKSSAKIADFIKLDNSSIQGIKSRGLNLGKVYSNLSNGNTNASNMSSIDNSKNPVYNINVQNDQSADLERTMRRLQFGF